MYSERTQLRLRDILDNIEAIENNVEAMPFAAFQSDQRTTDAVERCLQWITEAVIQIGETEMEAILPDIPFASIRGMGNKLRHEYHRIDAQQIYNTIYNELPPLRNAVKRALN